MADDGSHRPRLVRVRSSQRPILSPPLYRAAPPRRQPPAPRRTRAPPRTTHLAGDRACRLVGCSFRARAL